MFKNAKRLQTIKHLGRAVFAVVGVDQEIVEPDGPVVGDPFEDIGRLVFHAAHNHMARGSVVGLARFARREIRREDCFIDMTHAIVRRKR